MGIPGMIVHGTEKPKNDGHSETFKEVQLLLTCVLISACLFACTYTDQLSQGGAAPRRGFCGGGQLSHIFHHHC